MHWPEPAALEEPGRGTPDPEEGGQSRPENPVAVFAKRLVFILITVLVILSLLAPLLIPIFQTRLERPKQFRDGLQAHRSPPEFALVFPVAFL